MKLQRVFAAVSVLTLFCFPISAQSPHGAGPPESVEFQLHQHGIDTSTEGLKKALTDTDAEVRWLAAARLAENRNADSAPAILAALLAEKVPVARVNLAFSLAQLGDSQGLVTLRKVYANDEVPLDLRFTALQYLLDLRATDDQSKESLLEVVRAIPQNVGKFDPGYAISEGISLLLQFGDLTTQERRSVLPALLSCLSSPNAHVRLAASHALARTQGQSGIPYLRRALVNEKDPIVAAQIQREVLQLTLPKND